MNSGAINAPSTCLEVPWNIYLQPSYPAHTMENATPSLSCHTTQEEAPQARLTARGE